MNAITVSPEQFIFAQNHELKTTSLKVADAFGKRHDDVLKKVRTLGCSQEFNARNFAAVEYSDSKGEKRPAYEMTKDGFMFLVMGFTGKQAAGIKEAYINAFNLMYEKLFPRQPETKALPLPNHITKPEALRFRLSMQAHCKGDRVMYKTLYRKVYEHFNITEYAHIPAGRLSEAAKVAGIKLVAAKQTEVAPIQEQVPMPLSDENTKLSVNQIAELFERKNILLVSGNEFVAVSKQDYEGIKAYFALAVQLGKKLNLI